MKLKIVAPALLLAAVGTGAFAQGIEGHQIGYTAKENNGATYSTRNAPAAVAQEHVNLFTDGQARAEDFNDAEVTVFPTDLEEVKDRRFTR